MQRVCIGDFFNQGDREVKKISMQDLVKTKWFPKVLDLVQEEMDRQATNKRDDRPVLEQEASKLCLQIQGWTQSLANPTLSQPVRAIIENDLEKALNRRGEIDSQLAQMEVMKQRAKELVDPALVVDRLNRLAEVLLGNNPSRTNIELGLHIDKISCYADGSATVRTCKLGALAESVPFIPRTEVKPTEGLPPDEMVIPCVPRKRGLRRLGDGPGDRQELMDAAHHSSDVKRFEGLGPEWFWEDTFRPEPKRYPYQEIAEAVAAKKAEAGWSNEKLAQHFQMSIPTVRKAIRYAQRQSCIGTEVLPKTCG